MKMLDQLLGYGFRLNQAHPIYTSRKRLLRQSAFARAIQFIDSATGTSALMALSVIAVLSLALMIVDGRAPQIESFSHDEILRKLSISLSRPSAREASLARINLEQSRRSASVTHFISELIFKYQRNRNWGQAQKIASAIVSESSRLGFDPLFVASVIKYESTFNPIAKSHAGALGLMQMLPSTGQFISKAAGYNLKSTANLHDPVLNIKLGILYLAHLRSKFRGNKEQMLIAYNWGPENLVRSLKQGKAPPGSTVHYARRIITHHRDWERSFEAQSSRYRHFDFARAGTIASERSVG